MIHIIGLPVRVGTRTIQRCAWCGELIDEIDTSVVSAPCGDWEPWPVGKLLDYGDGSRTVRERVDGEPVPRGCCAFKPALRVITPSFDRPWVEEKCSE